MYLTLKKEAHQIGASTRKRSSRRDSYNFVQLMSKLTNLLPKRRYCPGKIVTRNQIDCTGLKVRDGDMFRFTMDFYHEIQSLSAPVPHKLLSNFSKMSFFLLLSCRCRNFAGAVLFFVVISVSNGASIKFDCVRLKVCSISVRSPRHNEHIPLFLGNLIHSSSVHGLHVACV